MFGPKIRQAIPLRRYRYGEFQVTVLGEVDSGDERDYVWIAAFVPSDRASPLLFVTCERDGGAGPRLLRVVAPHDEREFGRDARWGEFETFVRDALAIGGRLLELGDEEPHLLA